MGGRRLFHRLAVALGYAILLPLVLGLLAFGLRYAQVKLCYAPRAPERMEAKAAFLAGVPPVDPGAPSFVLIFFDDLGYGDLSSYGNRLIHTPRMDALAAQGIRLTDFYSAAPVCTPSRAALLTGRYPVRSGTEQGVFFSEASPIATLRKLLGSGNEILPDEILLPEVLQAAGYATGMVGKWHLGGIPGYRPNDFGFDSWFGVLWSNDMTPLHLYRDGEIEERDDRRGDPWLGSFRDASRDRGDGIDQRQLTRRYTDEAIRFLEAARGGPFFLYLAHTAPHVPHFASPEFAGRSRGGVYGDVVEDLDRSVGRVLDALNRLDLADDTLVIVTSDNGADYNGSPGPLRGRKGQVFEGGQRVPFIARLPGRIPAARVGDALGVNLDLFPTLLRLAGLPLPPDRIVDGHDLWPALAGSGPGPRERVFYFSQLGGRPAAVRDRRFKYRLASGDRGRSRPQLWRMDADAEAHDLLARFPEPAGRLAAELRELIHALERNPRGWR